MPSVEMTIRLPPLGTLQCFFSPLSSHMAWRIQALIGEGRSRAQVGAELGIGHPFVLDKVMEQVGRLGPAALEAAYRRLFETDVAVKTGVLDAPLALEILIVDLASMVTPRRRELRRA